MDLIVEFWIACNFVSKDHESWLIEKAEKSITDPIKALETENNVLKSRLGRKNLLYKIFTTFCLSSHFVIILSINFLNVNLSSKIAPRKTGFSSNGILVLNNLRSSAFGLVGPLWKMM